MIKYQSVTLVLAACLMLSSCGKVEELSAEQQEKIEHVSSLLMKEKRVEDVYFERMWIANYTGQWNIGVLPKQGSEIGYASYICDFLGYHNIDLNTQLVRVVDVEKLMREQIPPKAASLKRISCKTYMPVPE